MSGPRGAPTENAPTTHSSAGIAQTLRSLRLSFVEASEKANSGGSKRSIAWRIMRVLLVAVPLLFLVYGLVAWLRGWPLGVDSSVYRAAAVLFLRGHSPYDVNDLGYLHLSFTYPPAGHCLFTPLAALPTQLAWAVMASASVLARVW